ncbi:hypothetical protein MMC34_000220 [Xylographa carneopallida]|nr:hypothetical protein [Xylographa carneopallida]
MQQEYGVKELYRGENPTVDIIAIHGLNGDSLKTWTSKQSSTLWLSDPGMLPKVLKNARILTWGYNANVTALLGATSSDRILQHAQTLVAQLEADRAIEGASERPIIFVCHSLGGIVVKRALAYSASRTSKNIVHLHSIYVSTYAVIFFGTPHNGSDRVKLASTAQKMLSALTPKKIMDTNSQLLDALKEGSETLQNITDMFVPLMKQFNIFFFWEQEKTDLGYTQDYIVEEHSAAPILDNTERSGIAASHSDMCKFERNSSAYRTVLAALIRYSREAPDLVAVRWVQAQEMLMSKRVIEASELTRT